MSEIKTKSQNWTVEGKEDVIALYEGTQTNQSFPDTDSRIGMEVELNFYNHGNLSALNEEESARFICEGRRKAISIHNEPSTATLEILTDPYKSKDFGQLIEQMNRRFDELWGLSVERKAFPSPFAYLPHITPADHHFTRNERYSAMWLSERTDVNEARSSFLDPSIQVSISYKDYEHLLHIIRLSVVLEPFLILTTEPDAGFYEGQAVNGSPRTRILKRRGRNGGIPDFYLKAKSGEELINAHIEHTLHNQHVFLCFNHDGTLVTLPQGVWTSFMELEELGYGPQNLLNYRQAQSENWRRTTNISEIRDGDGTLYGHRAEISSLFCTGLQHQRVSSSIISCLIAYCSGFYNNISDLSKDFGIDIDDLYGCKTLLEQNFEAAHNHDGRYFDLPFGTGTLKDFAQGFAALSIDCLKRWNLDQHSQPLMHILTEGRPDWLVNRELFENLNQQKAYLSALPELAAKHTALISADSCADFTKDIVKTFLSESAAQ